MFSKHFQLVYTSRSSCPGLFPLNNQSTEVSLVAPISKSDTHSAIKRLWPTESVILDGTTSFVIKGYFGMFVPVLKFAYNLNLTQNTFLKLWMQADTDTLFKKWGRNYSVGNFEPISILSNISKVFEFVAHDDISHIL
jgi:hypothetical protein